MFAVDLFYPSTSELAPLTIDLGRKSGRHTLRSPALIPSELQGSQIGDGSKCPDRMTAARNSDGTMAVRSETEVGYERVDSR